MSIVALALQILIYVIVADAVLSWIAPSTHRFPRNITARLTEPLYRPLRKLLGAHSAGGFDFSPLILILGISALRTFLLRV